MVSASIHTALIWNSDLVKGMGAPLSAEVLRQMAEDEAISTALAPALLRFADRTPKEILNAAVPLRVLGAAHFLVLNGDASALAECYAKGGGPYLAQSLLEAISVHPDVVASFMASPPQTNEVRRSLCLFGGFLTVAEETGLPLRCLEIGASAGLNLNWDRFDYDLGSFGRWGDPASPVKLSGDCTGGAPPLSAKVKVAERMACDQNPWTRETKRRRSALWRTSGRISPTVSRGRGRRSSWPVQQTSVSIKRMQRSGRPNMPCQNLGRRRCSITPCFGNIRRSGPVKSF